MCVYFFISLSLCPSLSLSLTLSISLSTLLMKSAQWFHSKEKERKQKRGKKNSNFPFPFFFLFKMRPQGVLRRWINACSNALQKGKSAEREKKKVEHGLTLVNDFIHSSFSLFLSLSLFIFFFAFTNILSTSPIQCYRKNRSPQTQSCYSLRFRAVIYCIYRH